MIESDTSFDVLFIDFWEPGGIPDRDGYCKILKCLDCMTGFGLGAAIGLKEITSDQAVRWAVGVFSVPIGLQKLLLWTQIDFFLECSRRISNKPY